MRVLISRTRNNRPDIHRRYGEMEIIVRNVGKYKDVTIKTDTVEVDIGMFDKAEAAKLAYIFEAASDELIE